MPLPPPCVKRVAVTGESVHTSLSMARLLVDGGEADHGHPGLQLILALVPLPSLRPLTLLLEPYGLPTAAAVSAWLTAPTLRATRGWDQG